MTRRAAIPAVLGLCLAVTGCPTDDDPPPDAPLETSDLAVALAAQWAADEPAEDWFWDWMDAVYMLGMTRVHEVSGDDAHLAYATAWVDAYYPAIQAGDHDPDASDRVAPNTVAVELMRRHGDERYGAVPPMVDEYLATVPTAANGAFLHWGTHFPDKPQVLIDSLFMIGGYLVAEYDRTGDVAYLDTFVEQVGHFDELCRHDDEGLFVHAWDEDLQANIPADPIFWARGNGWIAAVTGWYLAVAPADHAGRAAIEVVYRGEIDGFVRYQDDSGLAHTILNVPDDPDNYLETSATALFAFALAEGLQTGVLDEETYRPHLVAAIEGLQGRIVEEPDGHLTVQGTSFGTVPTTYEIYLEIPLVDDLAMGVGTVLLALSAADGL